MFSSRTTQPIRRKQRGAAFIVMLVILIMGVTAFLVSSLNSSTMQIQRDMRTAEALAQAKEALIGYAVKVNIDSSCSSPCYPYSKARPGELPCPDNHVPGSALEGTPSTPCNSNALGRLPWKTLGLPDLMDSSGERLWYAVSTNFKNSNRIGTLNNDTPGTLTVFASDGTLVNDGSCITFDGSCKLGAVAIIIAPGPPLTRQGGAQQDRSSAGNTIASNYLDTATMGGNTIDNANFLDGSSTKGFIQGRVMDGAGTLIVNDQLLVVTQDNIMQATQKRVAGEVRQCLLEYASLNNGLYPWAVPLSDVTNYQDSTNQLFGRIPANLSNTSTDSGGGMSSAWGPMCNTHNINTPSAWWQNWQEMVFYGLSNAYKPASTPPAANACATAGNCVRINSASNTAKLVVIVAGKMLSTPNQTLRPFNQNNATYYLEGGNQSANQSGSYTFIQSAPSATFNDTVTLQ